LIETLVSPSLTVDTKTRLRCLTMTPEVSPEDLSKYNDAAIRLTKDLAPGESARWADLVNTAASMAELENDQGNEDGGVV
jgi:hypothetical protein